MEPKLTCIILDNEVSSIETISDYIVKNESLILKKTFTDSIDALTYILQNKVDLLITNVCMPKLSGIEIFCKINAKCQIIFMTEFTEKIVEAIEFGATDFLIKPFSISRFSISIEKAILIQSSMNQKNYASAIPLSDKDTLILERINFLTRCQINILRMISDEKSSKEIADNLNRSIKTIETHRTNIKDTLKIKGANTLNSFALKIKHLL